MFSPEDFGNAQVSYVSNSPEMKTVISQGEEMSPKTSASVIPFPDPLEE
jgi:hypothetical protein